ncbi:MAG: hypothetical protein PHO91_02250 [Patescibacteria group bacterium]|nr:hypothetical protein [Patescibacteria group bacterium]
MTQYIVFIGAFVQLAGIYIYVKETIKGNTKPNRVTWLMWSIAPLIATSAALSDGVRLAVLPVFMAGFAPLLVFIVSFANKKSYWRLRTFDYACGTLSILALILWWITKEPVVAIIFALAADFFAAMPTLIKSWKYPETESVEAYSTGVFNSLTSFFALRTFAISEIAFPIYLLILNSSLMLIIYRSRFIKNKNKKVLNENELGK